MARGLGKRKTLVINIVTKEEIIFESRFDACKYTGIDREALNGYMKRGTVFQKKYKFIDLYNEL